MECVKKSICIYYDGKNLDDVVGILDRQKYPLSYDIVLDKETNKNKLMLHIQPKYASGVWHTEVFPNSYIVYDFNEGWQVYLASFFHEKYNLVEGMP